MKKEYRNELGQLHRVDGPAVEWSDGSKEWYVDDKRHRLDGPAIESNSGYREWCINGKRHREDGPAIEWRNNIDIWWYLNGIRYSEEEYHKELIKLKLKRLIEL